MLRTGEAAARLEGTREELFSIVSDYGRYQAWIPGVETSGVLLREGDVTIAEVRAPTWTDRSFNLELVRSPPGTVELRQIDSLGRPGVSGRWEVGETEPEVGASTVLVRLRLRLETPLLSVGAGYRLRAALRAVLDALGARRRQLASGRGAVTAKRKILEVVRLEGGLEVWYEGETFLLPRAGGSGK